MRWGRGRRFGTLEPGDAAHGLQAAGARGLAAQRVLVQSQQLKRVRHCSISATQPKLLISHHDMQSVVKTKLCFQLSSNVGGVCIEYVVSKNLFFSLSLFRGHRFRQRSSIRLFVFAGRP